MPEPSFVQRFLRERALSRYLAALERGDIDTVISVLEQSAKDGVLERMIFDLHETYQTEEEFLEMVQEVQDEPDVVEVENGVFKSRLEGKLPALKRARRRGYRVLERAFQALVAAALIVCVLGSFLIYAQFQASSPNGGLPAFSSNCVTTGASTSAYSGVPVFNQVSISNARDGWVLGNIYGSASFLDVQPLLEHWDGTHWTIVPAVSVISLLQNHADWNGAFLQHMALVSAQNIWAVGGMGHYTFGASNRNDSYGQVSTGQALIEHWDGQHWQSVPGAAGVTESYSVLNDLAAISASNIWAAGYASDSQHLHASPLLEHWDGSRWTRVQPGALLPQLGVLDTIRAISADDIWVFGRSSPLFQRFPLAAHWNGQSWSVIALSSLGLDKVNSVTLLSSHDIWVAGSGPQTSGSLTPALVAHWDGQSWQTVAGTKELGMGTVLLGINAHQTNDIWAAGSAGDKRSLIMHWNGQLWKAIAHPSPAFAYLTDITFNSGKVWAVGGTYHNDFSQSAAGALIETSC